MSRTRSLREKGVSRKEKGDVTTSELLVFSTLLSTLYSLAKRVLAGFGIRP